MRGRSVGFALKVHQRAWALSEGLEEISWTFDPLISRNAHFNLVKLAAEPTSYHRNFYGHMADAPTVRTTRIACSSPGTCTIRGWWPRPGCPGAPDPSAADAVPLLSVGDDLAPLLTPTDARLVRVALPATSRRSGSVTLIVRRGGGSPCVPRSAICSTPGDACSRSTDRGLHHRQRRTGMKLTGFELRVIEMPLVSPFRTSFGVQTVREALLVRAVSDEAEGWGEGVAMNDPLYSSEYVEASVDVITRFLLPALAGVRDLDAAGVAPALAPFKGHRMSKAAVELAVLDAELRATECRCRASSAPSATVSTAGSRSASWTRSRNCSTRSPGTSTRGTCASS